MLIQSGWLADHLSELDASRRYYDGWLRQCRKDERKQLVARDEATAERETRELGLEFGISERGKIVRLGYTGKEIRDNVAFAVNVLGLDANVREHEEMGEYSC